MAWVSLFFFHPGGAFALTPASIIAVQAICHHQHLLAGRGLDWGSGTGCLAIAAARTPTVQQVIGLEVSPADVQAASQNAIGNSVAEKVQFLLSDSYTPYAKSDRLLLATWEGQTNFILANPPASEGDDGFEFRRVVLHGACKYLVKGGVVFLSISAQYGTKRIGHLCQETPGFRHAGVLHSSDWVPFDLQRPDLLRCLESYAREEQLGGFKYTFHNLEGTQDWQDAQTALARFHQSGVSPLTKWQVHLFCYMR